MRIRARGHSIQKGQLNRAESDTTGMQNIASPTVVPCANPAWNLWNSIFEIEKASKPEHGMD